MRGSDIWVRKIYIPRIITIFVYSRNSHNYHFAFKYPIRLLPKILFCNFAPCHTTYFQALLLDYARNFAEFCRRANEATTLRRQQTDNTSSVAKKWNRGWSKYTFNAETKNASEKSKRHKILICNKILYFTKAIIKIMKLFFVAYNFINKSTILNILRMTGRTYYNNIHNIFNTM